MHRSASNYCSSAYWVHYYYCGEQQMQHDLIQKMFELNNSPEFIARILSLWSQSQLAQQPPGPISRVIVTSLYSHRALWYHWFISFHINLTVAWTNAELKCMGTHCACIESMLYNKEQVWIAIRQCMWCVQFTTQSINDTWYHILH